MLLVTAWVLIRRRRVTAHKVCMLSAFVTSIAFLASYLVLRYFARHRRIARWVLPVWLYVSVTGVLVYVMLYRLYPSR